MRVFVKICGLNSADDVAAAVAAGADAVGFVFAESVRRVTPREAKEATRDFAGEVHRVAVMRHPSPDDWRRVCDEFEPDILQTDAADFATLDVASGVICWPVLRQGAAAELELPAGPFVYEGADSGTGETIDWQQAAAIAARGQMILAGGLAEDNVAPAIRQVRPWGVDVSSGVESMPGHKDHELVRRFVSAVRAAEKE